MSNDTARELLAKARPYVWDNARQHPMLVNPAEVICKEIDAYLARPAGAEASEGEVDAAVKEYHRQWEVYYRECGEQGIPTSQDDFVSECMPHIIRAALMAVVKGRGM